MCEGLGLKRVRLHRSVLCLACLCKPQQPRLSCKTKGEPLAEHRIGRDAHIRSPGTGAELQHTMTAFLLDCDWRALTHGGHALQTMCGFHSLHLRLPVRLSASRQLLCLGPGGRMRV